MISTAGDAALTVADPSAVAPRPAGQRHVRVERPAAGEGLQPGGRGRRLRPARRRPALLTYSGPISNDAVSIAFRQHIGAGQALRTGSYGKTLTFTLSTTTP